MRWTCLLFLTGIAPATIEAQMSGPGNALDAWARANCTRRESANQKLPPVNPPNAEDLRRYFSQLRANLATDRSSVTSNIFSIPLRGNPDSAPKRHFFRVWGNRTTAQVNQDDSLKRRLAEQGISDVQSIIDNGGNWMAEYAYERTEKCGDILQSHFTFHSGFGKLDAPRDNASDRFAGSVTLEEVLDLDLGELPGQFGAIIGFRGSYVNGIGNSLLVSENVKRLAIAQAFGALRIFNANLVTMSGTLLSQAKRYNPKFSIGVSVNR